MDNHARTPRQLGQQGGRLKVICTSSHCTHEAIVTPLELVRKGYGDISLNVIRRGLVCRVCGTGKPTVQEQLW